MTVIYLIFALLVAYATNKMVNTVKLGPGMKVYSSPWQTTVKNADSIEMKGFKLNPLAEFRMEGKILSKRRYWFGRQTRISKYDFAMGWKKMSDEEVLKDFTIVQATRWYRWSSSDLKMPRYEVISSSGNMHMIPADKEIARKLRRAKIGQIVDLRGYLVNATYGEDWNWQSSLTRTDIGSHACEVFYVKEFKTVIANKDDENN